MISWAISVPSISDSPSAVNVFSSLVQCFCKVSLGIPWSCLKSSSTPHFSFTSVNVSNLSCSDLRAESTAVLKNITLSHTTCHLLQGIIHGLICSLIGKLPFSTPQSLLLSSGSMLRASQSSLAIDWTSANPVCLYSEREVFALLMSLTAMSICIELDWSSLFTWFMEVRMSSHTK